MENANSYYYDRLNKEQQRAYVRIANIFGIKNIKFFEQELKEEQLLIEEANEGEKM